MEPAAAAPPRPFEALPNSIAAPGSLALREPPFGLPDPNIRPPTVAVAGDPFASLRVIDMLARIERGRPIRLADVAAALEATYLDWAFPLDVVVHVALQLQVNWMSDYRNASGIELDEGPYGPTIAIEDSSRVDPWVVGQALAAAATCRVTLDEFSRQDRPGSND